MKIDPHNHKRRYENWKKIGVIERVSELNSEIIVRYLTDMENGLNVTRKGGVSFARLNNLKQRLGFITREMQKIHGSKNITEITEQEIVSFFKSMRDGKLRTLRGKKYTSVPDYINVFKAFWHWYQRVENDDGRHIKDITRYIDSSPLKESEFVYLTPKEIEELIEHAKFDYKVLMRFIFDSGIRSPTELVNVRVSDLYPLKNSDKLLLHIRDDISKTYARKIKLLLCSSILKRYIEQKGLGSEDRLFPICQSIINQYLKRIAVRVLGDKKTLGGSYTHSLTMYDFRHCSASYWCSRYKDPKAFLYRFGWKSLDMFYYYTKLLGMQDTISEDDLIADTETKTTLEINLDQAQREKLLLEDQLETMAKERSGHYEQIQQMQQKINWLMERETKRKSYDEILYRISQIPQFKEVLEKVMVNSEENMYEDTVKVKCLVAKKVTS